ncbi:hypothetical protein KCH_45680 [Kitasatospora cheerisanensis KCTC 2395]|uniref:Uncharacterized protein n=1 Tax=Kitasatospora cheerisanensis KCTC 2395 TaxID=1348663 RepID=A0A066YVB0_9ACTN|nr:hypothetical protein KCH_45680 [Kitasatospora cheerisanensis KCTC 2395]
MTAFVLPPLPAVAVPPRREVPDFPPIRGTARGRHRLRQALRRRPGACAAGFLALAAALASGPLRPAPPPGSGATECPRASTGGPWIHP